MDMEIVLKLHFIKIKVLVLKTMDVVFLLVCMNQVEVLLK